MAKSASVLRNPLSEKHSQNYMFISPTDSSWPLGCVLRGRGMDECRKVYRGDKISNPDSARTLEIGCADQNRQIIRIAEQKGIGEAPKKTHVGVRAMTLMGNGKAGACRESWRRLSQCGFGPQLGFNTLSPYEGPSVLLVYASKICMMYTLQARQQG